VTGRERRVRLDLAYDGTGFRGWQYQPGEPTVQGVVEKAFSRVLGERPVRLRAAGRTDAGVHARQQVTDTPVTSRLEDDRLLQALDATLPGEVRPLCLSTVEDEFHCRSGAVSKCYQYLLDLSPHGDPFLRRYALHHPSALNLDAMENALERLPGKKDWAGFAGSASRVESTVRDLRRAEYAESEDGIGIFTFAADGFLNHMVRTLVGTLLEIARGRFLPEMVDEILATKDRRRAGPTAPAAGLCLVQVLYQGEEDRISSSEPWTRCRVLARAGPAQGRG